MVNPIVNITPAVEEILIAVTGHDYAGKQVSSGPSFEERVLEIASKGEEVHDGDLKREFLQLREKFETVNSFGSGIDFLAMSEVANALNTAKLVLGLAPQPDIAAGKVATTAREAGLY